MPAATAFSQIGQIASMRGVHEAFQWLHLHERQIMQWQVELVSIPAPPFAEQARAAWLLARFEELGMADVHLDPAGNVLATIPAPAASSGRAAPLILLSAHLDTVFPATTPACARCWKAPAWPCPGACDNGAGVAALLALAAAFVHTGLQTASDIVFAGNVGEEGEGDLRGMRQIYSHAPWRSRIAAHLVLDGAGQEIAVTGALGSRRFAVELRGSGGHSWTDAGRPNPIATLCAAVAAMSAASISAAAPSPAANGNGRHAEQPLQPLASSCTSDPAATAPRSAWNVGTIEGGGSVNTIPDKARARFDLRSTDSAELLRLEVALHRAVEDAVLAANAAGEARADRGHALTFSINRIGDRPAGGLPEGARILELLRGVDRHLNLRTECRTASTDAKHPTLPWPSGTQHRRRRRRRRHPHPGRVVRQLCPRPRPPPHPAAAHGARHRARRRLARVALSATGTRQERAMGPTAASNGPHGNAPWGTRHRAMEHPAARHGVRGSGQWGTRQRAIAEAVSQQ